MRQVTGVEQDKLPFGATGATSGNCREMETRTVWAGHDNHDSLSKAMLQGTLEGGRCHGWQKKLLDGQHWRVDIPAPAGTVDDGLPQKRLVKSSAESSFRSP